MKKISHFDYKQLENLTFGKLDGENDINILNSSFISTSSVTKFLKMEYNYVLSPKGSGKTALYKSLENKIIHEKYFDYNKYYFVFVDQAFGQLDENLILDNFSMPENYKSAIFSWALYLFFKILDSISNETRKKELNNINNLFNEFKIYDKIKNKYQLFSIMDIISILNLRLTLNIKGQRLDFGLSPNNLHNDLLDMNTLFSKLNSFFKDNNKKLVVLIDRLDSFVKREKYSIQKYYIQGLLDTIEELTTYQSLQFTVFLRTDLFYSLNLNIEYDKAKDRVLYLEWEKHEVLKFITKRLMANSYIKNNFKNQLERILKNEIYKRISKNGKSINPLKKLLLKISKNNDLPYDKNLYYSVYEGFIKLFLPNKVSHINRKGQEVDIELCLWIFTHFRYQNDFINPRVIIHFFNTLFIKQYEEYYNDATIIMNENNLLLEPININDFSSLNIFSKKSIIESYDIIRNEELKNIYLLISDPKERNLFREIITKSYSKGEYQKSFEDCKNFDVSNEAYDRLLEYLVILGFFKLRSGSNIDYILPFVFRRDIIIEHNT